MQFSTYRPLVLTAALVLSLGLAACKDNDHAKAKYSGPVAATVNGETIYEEEVNASLSGLPQEILNGREAQIRQQILNQLIEGRLFTQAAKDMGIKDDEAYKKQLHDMKQQLKQNFAISKYLEQNLTQERIQQVYNQNQAQLAFPAVRARHILVDSEAKAKELIKVANASNFAELAREHSTGPTGPNGGDLGYFRKEAMVPAFAEVAFNTAAGTVAKAPVKTQFGWHVVYVEDKNDAYVPPVEQVAEQIQAQLSQVLVQEYLQKLKNEANIVIENTTDVTPAAGTEAQ